MNIIPTTSHPSWCDPRTCKSYLAEDGAVSYEHREAAPVLRPAAQRDAELTIRRTQIDDRSAIPCVGDVCVTLVIADTSSSPTYGGDAPLTLDVDLDPMDARMLAAQLVVMAEQVEATRLASRGAASGRADL
jgi:hypothetical protein